ncbi:MAG: hypothetical protein KTR25_02080 [Myxococcales bacterium]|nr:hypothetical protein [Myxococcales bacterium]
MPSLVFPESRPKDFQPIAGIRLCFRYILESYIETRSIGQLWCATDILLRRRVLVQFIHPELAPTYTSEGRAARAHFLEEVDILMRLSLESTGLIDRGELPGGWLFVVYQSNEGEWLNALAKRKKYLSAQQTVSLLIQLGSLLKRCHWAGIVHGGILPENIRVVVSDEKITCHLWDFGIARLSSSATEQAQTNREESDRLLSSSNRQWTEATDVYALSHSLWTIWNDKDPEVQAYPLVAHEIDASNMNASLRVQLLFDRMLFTFREELRFVHADDVLSEARDIRDQCDEELLLTRQPRSLSPKILKTISIVGLLLVLLVGLLRTWSPVMGQDGYQQAWKEWLGYRDITIANVGIVKKKS